MLLLRWASNRRARNVRVLIVYLFFHPVMLPSVLPRLGTDSAVRRFPGVWKLLSFYLLYFFLSPLKDKGLLFWVLDVLCQHLEVVLWNLLSVQMFF